MKKSLGFTSLLLAAISFGSFGIWIRLLNREMSIYQQIILRNFISFVIAILIVILAQKLRTVQWKKVRKQHLLSYALLVPLAVVAYNVAMINTKIATATFAFYIGTILTGWLAGTMIYCEKLTTTKWGSLILVLLGLGLFAYPFDSTSLNLGFISGVISGVLDGSANAFRKKLAGKIDKFVLVLLTAIGGLIVSGAMILYFNQSITFFASMSTTTWAIGLFFGGLLMTVNYLLLVGFENFDLALGSIVLSMELLFALIFGIVIFGEVPTGRELLGGGFILLANVLPNLRLLLRKKRSLNWLE